MQKVAALLMLVVGIFTRTDAVDSLNCRLVGSCILEGPRSGIALSGDFAYVSGGYGSLWILDVANPTAPYIVGRFDTTDMSRTIAVSGSLAYMVAYGSSDGLWIIDVSDPQEPYAVARCSLSCVTLDIVLSGDYAYLPAGSHGLRIVDVSEPLKPREVGYWDGPLSTQNVALSGNLAYVAQNDSDLYVVDVSKPQAPYAVGHCSLPGFALRVAVSGDFAYVAGFDVAGKLWVIDVSNPQEPYQVGGAFFPGTAKGVAVSGEFVYVVSRQGLYVIDVSDPRNPHLAGWYVVDIGGLAVSGNLAYTPGLEVIEFLGEGVAENGGPEPKRLTLETYPNPVQGALLVRYDVPRQAQASIGIYDIGGRLVRSLSEGKVAPGRYEAKLPARALPAGVYFCTLDNGERRISRKIVLTE